MCDNYYIICNHSVYKYMEDYILSFYKKINAKIIIYDNSFSNIPEINNINIYIFVQSIPDELLSNINNNINNIYLINTEQLSYKKHYDRINEYPKYIKMLDYSMANLKYYDKKYYTKFLSYQINYDEIYNLHKTKDICIMSGESENRTYIINQIISKGYNIDIISGWKQERDLQLFTYKILLNVSYEKDYKIFEPLRCDRCIFNKMIVISDNKEDIDLYNLKDYMIFEEYNNLANKVIEVFNNYDTYYKKLGLDILNLETLENLHIEPISL